MNTNNNIKDIQLNNTKKWTDGNKYFSLFSLNLPKIEGEKKIFIYDISNFSAIVQIMEFYPNAKFYIYGAHEVNECLKATGYIFEEVRNNNEYNIPDMMFDCTIMNPPWGDKCSVGIAQKILKTVTKHTVNDIVCLYGENEFYGVHNKHRFEELQHCDTVRHIAANESFGINTRLNAVIVHLNPNKIFDKVTLIDEIHPEWNGTYDWSYIHQQMIFPKMLCDIFNSTKSVYDRLIEKSLTGGMTNLSNDQFEYYENKLRDKDHANDAVANSKYNLILNRTSFENQQDEYYDVVKNIGGCTWTCKNENIKANMYYWLHDCPLTFLWRKYFILGTVANCCSYKILPTVNFDMAPEDFKKWCDTLIPGFNQKYSIEDITKIKDPSNC